MKLHASGEDYLETILVLQKELGMVRSVDLSCPAKRGKKKTVAGQVASCAHNGFSGYCGGFE